MSPKEREVLEKLMEEAGHDVILNKKMLAKELKVTPRTIEYRMKTGQIPYFKVGRCVRFSRNAVLARIYSDMNGL